MSKDKKDIDYWDRYYGSRKNKNIYKEESGKDEKNYSKREMSQNVRTGRRSSYSDNLRKSYSSRSDKNDGYEARIVGSEYKLKKKKRRSGISRVILIMLFVIFVFFLGFFTFYAIDNDLFGKKENIAKNANVNDEAKSSNIRAQTEEETKEEDILITGSENTVSRNGNKAFKEDTGSGQTPNNNGSNDENNQISFGQKIINFFKKATGRPVNEENYPDALKVNIYFSMLGNEIKFGSESRIIAAGNTQNAVTNIMNELLKGPYKEYNFAVIPPGTRLLDVKIVNDIAQINLSQEFLSNSLDSGVLDEYIIYTIVDTVTEIAEIRAVTFCIDGKEIKEYGNVDLRIPAIRNEKYLEDK